MVLPTRGENFGHVIIESLMAGTAVLISEKTSWVENQSKAIKILPLDNMQEWANEIDHWASFNLLQYSAKRSEALNHARKILKNRTPIEKNLNLFRSAIRLNANAGKIDAE